MNNQAGSILIVIMGALALMFTIGVVVLVLSAHSSRTAQNGNWGAQARFSADSALEVSLGTVSKFCDDHDSLTSSISTTTEENDFAFLSDLLTKVVENKDYELFLLSWENRRSVFDLQISEAVMKFPSATSCEFSEAYTQLEQDGIETSGLSFPSADELEDGEVKKCEGEGIWNLKIYGWGRVFRNAEDKIPVGSMVAMEDLKLSFKVAIEKTEEDEPLRTYVYFPALPKIMKRKFLSFSDVGHLQWPTIE